MKMTQKIKDWINSPEMEEMRRVYKEARDIYDNECEAWWKDLSYEDKLKAFYVVTKRIHQGDVVDRGSFRYVLYDVFNFDMDSYLVGMDSGYMEIHNAIAEGVEVQDGKRKARDKDSEADASGRDSDNDV